MSVGCDEDAVSACSKDTDSETVETKASDEAQAPTFGNDGEYRCRTFGGANSGKVSVVTMEKEWKAYNNRGPYVYCDDRCGLVVGAITHGPAPIAGTLDDSNFFGGRIFQRYVAASPDGAAGKDRSDQEFFSRIALVEIKNGTISVERCDGKMDLSPLGKTKSYP